MGGVELLGFGALGFFVCGCKRRIGLNRLTFSYLGWPVRGPEIEDAKITVQARFRQNFALWVYGSGCRVLEFM